MFSATKQIRESEATDAQKLISQSEKLLNVILRAKLKLMKNVFSNEINNFCNAEDDFLSLAFLRRKSHFRA